MFQDLSLRSMYTTLQLSPSKHVKQKEQEFYIGQNNSTNNSIALTRLLFFPVSSAPHPLEWLIMPTQAMQSLECLQLKSSLSWS